MVTADDYEDRFDSLMVVQIVPCAEWTHRDTDTGYIEFFEDPAKPWWRSGADPLTVELCVPVADWCSLSFNFPTTT